MLARAHAFTIDLLQTRHVGVEVDVRAGLPAFTIVGLADAAVREARERINAAIRNSGLEFPARRITANLAPGGFPKSGPGLDLALACAVLAASGQIPQAALEQCALFGELALDGSVRSSRGTLAVAEATRRAGLPRLLLAGSRAHEAQLIEDLEVAVVERLSSAVRVLSGGAPDPLPRPRVSRGNVSSRPATALPAGDLSEVRGQPHAVRAMVVAAAGAHSCLLSGPPGVGKTMLAHRLPSILPPLTRSEAIAVAQLHSAAGESIDALSRARPFRAPHHSITAAGLLGGARRGWVGEAALAHTGVLFLDELSEFARPTLEALRQPLEDGRMAIVRGGHSAVHPTRFMLVAATNPCPCGHGGEGERCSCGEAAIARYRRKLSGPLLDRIDLLAALHRRSDRESTPELTSAQARNEVLAARERQRRRLRGEGVAVNAQMDARMLGEHVRLDARGEEMLRRAHERGLLSARGHARVRRVSRTIADLEGSSRVRARDVGAALALRPDVALAEAPAV